MGWAIHADAVAVAQIVADGFRPLQQLRQVQVAQAPEAVQHDGGLGLPLARRLQVLQVAAAALAIVGARGLAPARTRLHHLQDLGLQESSLALHHPGAHPVAGSGQGYEDGLAVVAGQPGAAGDQLVDDQVQDLVRRRVRGVAFGAFVVHHGGTVARTARRSQKPVSRPPGRKDAMTRPPRTSRPFPRSVGALPLLAATGLLAAAVAGCAPKRVVNGTAVAGAAAPAPTRSAPRPAAAPRPASPAPTVVPGFVMPDLPAPRPRGPSGAELPERRPESVSLGAEAAALAREEVGKPYQWGAAGPDAYDCSGLVQHVFGQLGIDLPRVSRDQAAVGQEVRRSELQAGDLLFFSIDGGDIDHVGIYVGDSEFIHAPRRYVPVSVESLHNAWWRRHFRQARRVP